MPEVVVTEFMHPPSVAALEEEFEVLADPELGTDRKRLLPSVSTTIALIVRNETRVDAELLEAAPALRLVARLGVGLDNIDVAGCLERNIEVAPAAGANTTAVAEYVIGALLHLARGVFDQSQRLVEGHWPRGELRGRELAGKKLGLLGYGLISREVATRAIAMGMGVAAHDPFIDRDDPVWGPVEPLSLEDLLAGVDALSVHVPLTTDTRHLIDGDRIAMMRRGAFLVNTARGGVVDERAVVDNLSSGHLGGAALDVFETEPIDKSSGALFEGLPNLILTPHIAGITEESERRIGEMTVAAVRRHLGDSP